MECSRVPCLMIPAKKLIKFDLRVQLGGDVPACCSEPDPKGCCVAPDCVIHGNGIHRDGERPCGRRSTAGLIGGGGGGIRAICGGRGGGGQRRRSPTRPPAGGRARPASRRASKATLYCLS